VEGFFDLFQVEFERYQVVASRMTSPDGPPDPLRAAS